MTAISEERLRFRTAWLGLGWVMVVGVVVGSLLPSSVLPQVTLWDKFQHLGAYAALAFVFAGATPRQHWGRVFWGLLAVGLGLELLQALIGAGRSGDGWDMAANALGVLAGLGVAACIPGGWCRRVEDWLVPRSSRP